jgi:hypothetical protein|tara:strand:+ start:28216 stop:28722 length:507 start_codon:yes stop_codon:yes gene_type:complete
MAVTTGATLTSTISETITLNGAVRGNTNTVSIENINNIGEKIVTIPQNIEGNQPTYIATFSSAVNTAPHTNYDYDNALYARVTNLSETESIQVAWVTKGGKAADSCRFLLGPGQTSMMWDAKRGKLGECSEPNFAAPLTDLTYVSILNTSEAQEVDIELFVASGITAA